MQSAALNKFNVNGDFWSATETPDQDNLNRIRFEIEPKCNAC